MHRALKDIVSLALPATRMVASLVVVAACASEPDDLGVDVPPRITPDGFAQFTCHTTIESLCADANCSRTLAAALQDKSLCEGLSGWATCGDDQVVYRADIDTGAAYYYERGKLVAIGSYVLPRGLSCVAGPSRFTAPLCSSGATTLPQCLVPGH